MPFVPPRPGPSRIQFCLRSLKKIALHLLLIDLAQTYSRLNPLFGLSGEDALSIGAQGILLRPVNVAAYMIPSYSVTNISYWILGIVFVTLHLSEPHQWPDVFGRWSDAYTVRRYWR